MKPVIEGNAVDTGFRARCSDCPWVGEWRLTEDEAAKDAYNHSATADDGDESP